MAETATILQAQWKKIGVDLTIVPTSNFVSDFYLRKLAPLGLNPEVRGGLEGLDRALQSQRGDRGYPAITTIRAWTRSPARSVSWLRRAPRPSPCGARPRAYIVKNALSVWIDFSPYIYASAKSVHGVSFMLQYALPVPYFWSLSVAFVLEERFPKSCNCPPPPRPDEAFVT